MKWSPTISGAIVASLLLPAAAVANNVGENVGWQFQTTADKVNRAYIEDMRQKRQNGYYAPPQYNTTIQRQYNCSVTADATGNASSSSNVANSPSTSGHSASSTGNANSNTTNSGYGSGSSENSSDQSNSGTIRSETSGRISTSVSGDHQQAINTDQNNSGNQYASVTGSTACQYGVLN